MISSTFNCSIRYNEKDAFLALSGYINESASLPALNPGQVLHINLEDVTGLNSIGTKNWCDWLKAVSSIYEKIVLDNCPVIFVKSFNQVAGSLTEKTDVNSIKVPFYSDALDERKNITFFKNKDYSFDGPFEIPVIKDSAGNEMEIDVIVESYFAFLRR